MVDQYINCPHCGKRIPLTEAFTHDIEEKLRKEFDLEATRKDRDLQKTLEARESEFAVRLTKEKAKFLRQAKKEAEESISAELSDLKSELEKKAKQLKDAERKELDFLKRQHELDERERTIKLDTERILTKERNKIWEQASSKALEDHQLKDREKDQQLTEMRKQIEDLRRKAEQGSQQAQGEALEIELEELLRYTFRTDDIEPISKGTKGGDLVQRVTPTPGINCGSILWEAKHTRAWSDAWVDKLKDDQRQAKADLSVLVTSALPKTING